MVYLLVYNLSNMDQKPLSTFLLSDFWLLSTLPFMYSQAFSTGAQFPLYLSQPIGFKTWHQRTSPGLHNLSKLCNHSSSSFDRGLLSHDEFQFGLGTAHLQQNNILDVNAALALPPPCVVTPSGDVDFCQDSCTPNTLQMQGLHHFETWGSSSGGTPRKKRVFVCQPCSLLFHLSAWLLLDRVGCKVAIHNCNLVPIL